MNDIDIGPEWVEQVISRMKQYGITQMDLALESGRSQQYISTVLCERYNSECAERVISLALHSIIQRIEKGECKDG